MAQAPSFRAAPLVGNSIRVSMPGLFAISGNAGPFKMPSYAAVAQG